MSLGGGVAEEADGHADVKVDGESGLYVDDDSNYLVWNGAQHRLGGEALA